MKNFEALESAVTIFHSAAQDVGRDPSTLKVFVRANVPITATPLPEGKRPFLGGSPEQIAQKEVASGVRPPLILFMCIK